MTAVPGSSQFEIQRPAKSRHPKGNASATMINPVLEASTQFISPPINFKAFRHYNKSAGVDPDFINIMCKVEPATTISSFHKFVTVDVGNRKDNQLSRGFRTVKLDRPDSYHNSCSVVNRCD